MWQKLILLGDSHTQFGYSIDNQAGWVGLLSNLLQRKCDVVNRGFSGYNTRNILTHLSNILEEFDPNSVIGLILLVGSNDSAAGITNVSLEDYYNNLNKIYSYLVDEWKLDKNKLLVICPPRIHNQMYIESEDDQSLIYTDESVIDYSRKCMQFTKDKQLACIDLYKMMLDFSGDLKELLSDGLHLSAKGHLMMYENVKDALEKKILNDIQENYPNWDIANSNEN